MYVYECIRKRSARLRPFTHGVTLNLGASPLMTPLSKIVFEQGVTSLSRRSKWESQGEEGEHSSNSNLLHVRRD